jgi:hypothetical protein
VTPFITQLQRRVGRFPIEIPAAAALAFAVAMLVVALPDWRFESGVAATGLGNVLPAAQPPLGTTARIVVALVLAAMAFLVALFGLRALDGKPDTSDFPAFRAADLHPDAPRRRPILAGAEFGTPVDEPAPPARRRALVAETLPSFLAPQPPQIADLVPEPEMFPAKKKRADHDEIDGTAGPEVMRESHEPAARVETAPAAEVPSFLQAPARDVDAVRAREAEARPDDADADDWLDQGPERAPDLSVASLMQRLESGVARHGGRPPAGATGPSSEDLRRALGDLNRMGDRR